MHFPLNIRTCTNSIKCLLTFLLLAAFLLAFCLAGDLIVAFAADVSLFFIKFPSTDALSSLLKLSVCGSLHATESDCGGVVAVALAVVVVVVGAAVVVAVVAIH